MSVANYSGVPEMNLEAFLHLENPKFKDFMRLKVGGTDSFSKMRYAALRKQLPPEVVAQVDQKFEVHAERAACYRWILRGLTPDLAIHKIKVGLEVEENAREAQFFEFKDGEEIRYEPPGLEEVTLGEYVLIRPHANKVVITKDGEVLAEKEINNEKHYQNFLTKFKRDETYRAGLTGAN
jgi:hypothetical protein